MLFFSCTPSGLPFLVTPPRVPLRSTLGYNPAPLRGSTAARRPGAALAAQPAMSPAMQAVMKFASVAASMARSPSFANSERRSGMSDPIPPT